ncbi:MAG TPA: SUMF1/EgtB/PvdO family nonheme iron enzyme [Gemmatimonadaceae bacterium]|nr:SUMF1/EgtB/PvdO family nonheme iron enzyme [Gemmatimonadaceae bacterium]
MRLSRWMVLIAAVSAAVSSTGTAHSSLPLLRASSPARKMVRVPAGTYRPMYAQQTVAIASFSLDRDPVTRAEYLAWKGAPRPPGEDARRPMTGVTWSEASAFCSARGGRLPTLAEWEYAAAAKAPADLVATYASRSATPPAVDRGVTNALGIRGMHDLVWEWVADPNDRIAALWHAGMGHRHSDGKAHDMSCAGAAIGAADPRDYPAFLRGAIRSGLTESTRMETLGFRCAA